MTRPDDPEKEKSSARSIALRRLSAREQSSLDLRRYLERKGVEREEAEETVRRLVEEGMVDDRRYARALARDQSFKDKGPRHVANLLRQKGVKIDVAEARTLLGEVTTIDEEERVRSILERRYPKAGTDEREKRRAFQALLRRGFSTDIVLQVLKSLK